MAVDYNDQGVTWLLETQEDVQSDSTGIRFVDKYFDGRLGYCITFSITCSYSSYPAFDTKLALIKAEESALRKTTPAGILEAYICGIKIPSCPSYCSSPLEYLKVMESWMVVAEFLEDDPLEFTEPQVG